MPLFQPSVLKHYQNLQDSEAISKAYTKYTRYFLNPTIQDNIRSSKEEEYQGIFLTELFVNILGYTLKPKANYNLVAEYKNQNNARKADGAILDNDTAVGVIELKGTNTKDLESIRKQAFDYKANQKGCVYVITSNFEKLRFYINDATEFLEFNLFELTPERFALLYICLQKDNVLNNTPLKIKEASVVEEEQITKQFYKDYSIFKRELFRDLVKRNAKTLKNEASLRASAKQSHQLAEEEKAELLKLEKNVKLTLFKKSQKLIDRYLFIFFAEDRGLLPPNSTQQILDKWKADVDFGDDRPLYNLFKQYFHHLDQGRAGTTNRAEIYAYNGGLFKEDKTLDSLDIDSQLLYKHTSKLAAYDFESQVDVNILGHIFENSLNEIESVNAEIEGADFDKQKSKRKKDGVFYTPKYITKYIVENTIGKLCEEKKTELGFKEEEYYKGRKNRNKSTITKLVAILDTYRDWLLQLTICDPACGSGAFLNQALNFLIAEHQYIDELKTKVLGGGFQFPDIENTILENNIYGVDLNEESVEIAKLSLWLRTAQPRRKLNDLSSNIKCGNSLIDSKTVAGDKAFNWETEFPQVFAKGGFDVIIGNPPYVSKSFSDSEKKYYHNNYSTAQYQLDLYISFFEKGTNILRANGQISYIIPNSWLKNLMFDKCRLFVLDNLSFEIIIPNLENIFTDASVDTMIFVASKAYKHKKEIEIGQFNLLEYTKKHSVNQERFRKNEKLIFDVEISQESQSIFTKIDEQCVRLCEISDVTRGINPYDKYRGQSADIIKNKLYHSNHKKDDTFIPEIRGKHVNRYSLEWDNESFVSYGDWLAAPREPKYFKGNRIICRQVLGKNLNCTFLDKDFIIDQSVFIAKFDNDQSDKLHPKFILAQLSSKLLSFYFRYKANEFDALFPKIKIGEYKNLPIIIRIRSLQTPFIEAVNIMLDTKSILFNLIVKFQNYLTTTFQLQKLSKKLQNWHELEFGDFIKELNKAIKANNKLRVKDGLEEVPTLTKKDEFEWLDLFEDNKQKAQALQTQINQTDKQIDAMVYQLYGLTDDEISIVENS
ncbi:MAG: restriction endonuclease subunit M [Flavobacteriaceae bacterium]|nr:restriction endonuclease subunit M [Flavobacteriaceae bacterium]|tara:strand:- start:168 stop:3335 length:3168 start_codon:yes stop_codon:yes gene_type:complete